MKGLVYAYKFSGRDNAENILEGFSLANIKKISKSEFIWLHFDNNYPETTEALLSMELNLDKVVSKALLAKETRPRSTQTKNGILLNLRGANLNDNADPEDMVSLRIWVEENLLISVRRRKLKAITDLVEIIEQKQSPKNSAELLIMLTARLFKRMQPVIEELGEVTDNFEDKIFAEEQNSLRKEVVEVRRKAIIFRRFLVPQKFALKNIEEMEVTWFKLEDKKHLHESYNVISRYLEDVEEIRERANILKDELSNVLSERLNKNMYVLSVISAIFLPLGFLTGLFGINVGGIPGSNNGEAFWLFSGYLLIVVIIQIILFKKLKLF